MRNALQAYPDRQRHLQNKMSVTGFALPSQAAPLIKAGALKEVFFWNPKEVGLALVAVASLVLKKAEFKTGMDIPGIGTATVSDADKIISVSRMLVLNKQTLPDMVKLGV